LLCECGYSRRDAHHKHYHDLWEHGEKLKPLATDIVIARSGNTEVLVVPFGGRMEQRKRAQRVGWQGNRETRYDFGVYDRYSSGPSKHGFPTYEMTACLARQNGRGIGIAVLQHFTHCASLTWADFDARVRDVEFKPLPCWTVSYVWTHRSHRRRGVASLLVRSAADYLRVPLASVAWLTPFKEGGEALARRLTPDMLHAGAT
jgi:GNAT superfamily N-acetyltransferase